MAAPETLRIVQAVHDTAHVVMRDTVVRVAEPLHAAKSGGFFGEKSPSTSLSPSSRC